MVTCMICSNSYHQITEKHLLKHGLDFKKYVQMFPDAKTRSESVIRKQKNNHLCPSMKEYWVKIKGYDEPTASIHAKEMVARISDKSSNAIRKSDVEYWVARGHSQEDAERISKENRSLYASNSIESAKRLHGDKAQEVLLKRRETVAFKNSREYLLSSGHSEEDIKGRFATISLDSFIKRYGEEEGKCKYEAMRRKLRSKSKRCLEYWVNTGMSLEEAKEAVSKEQTRGLEWYISKFGEAIGNEKFLNRNRVGFTSKESILFFERVFDFLISNGVKEKDIFWGSRGSREFFLRKDRFYFYDFTILPLKVIIEYNGLLWHPSLTHMSRDDFEKWSHPFEKGITAQDKVKFDIIKNSLAIERGFSLLEVWNTDNLDVELNRVISFLADKLRGFKDE